ncbi:MAG TPA: segregation/condensation protein A [Clostridiales bacterium]|jgi:segregation and condensation protein A|nr:segregation/condensation protein A [Clostridiales bacterium]
MEINYKIEVFEGPLDLLLHLISKHKLNIYDIPIFELVEQYTSYVRQMEEENLDVASDFLEMAARLVHIKTVSLLPSEKEDAEELKRELTGELLEYRDCKIIASKLAKQTGGFDKNVRVPAKLDIPVSPYNRLHDILEIYRAYINAAGKRLRKLPPPVSAFAGIVAHKIVSVHSRITGLLELLSIGRKQRFSTLFENAESRSELVATFLAVLELTKAKRVRIDGDGDDCEIELISSEEGEYVLEFE